MPLNPAVYSGPAYVVAQERIAPNCLRMRLAAPVAGPVAAGTFAHILCDEEATDPLLRRPFTFWDVQPQKEAWTNLDIVYTVVGKGTEILARKKPLDTVGFLGPVGIGFTPNRERDLYVFVAGGVGIVPFFHFARQIRESGNPARILLLFGARNQSMLYGIDDFSEWKVETLAATDDGSRGRKGLVTDLLAETLRKLDRSRVMLYTCGPDRMMDGVVRIARKHGLPCEVSMERRMGCALGACGACVTKVRDGGGWRYSRICWEGPAYDADRLVLE
jgi:dihydroorotate dehydrogenase electron transfer subunit